MRGDAGHDARQARGMINTEDGLHFAKDGDDWRCVECPAVTMRPGERYRAGERTFGSLNDALRHLEAREQPGDGHTVMCVRRRLDDSIRKRARIHVLPD